ncbi:unnamed protein product [Polarella glacialis]|uniref:Uncharacterized protein n=1 Tax=Polarella glacialis TaxID=89957 RepID=A0A813DRQ4_POLGL|nr:unnamed protein product [Polarella glacialis]
MLLEHPETMTTPSTPSQGPSPLAGRRYSGGSAPPTPNLGPVGPRSRAGSASAWQLVEVSGNRAAAAVRSNQGSPAIPLLRSPLLQSQPGLGEFEENWSLDKPEASEAPAHNGNGPRRRRSNWADNYEGVEWPEPQQKAPSPSPEVNPKSDGFDPQYFLGEWMDNLGHRIMVTPAESWGGGRRRDRERNGGAQRLAFAAILHRPGVPDKRFTIAPDTKDKDRSKPGEWRCGNGVLVREESSMEVVSWLSEDGRKSTWTRPVPEGPVYFDPSPEMAHMYAQGGPNGWYGHQEMYWMNNTEQHGEWKETQEGVDDEGAEGDKLLQEATAAGGFSGGNWPPLVPLTFNPEAPEFVPSLPTPQPSPALGPRPGPPLPSRSRASPQMIPAPSPSIRPRAWGRTPTPSPMFGPSAAPSLVAPAPIMLQLSEESPDVRTFEARMEWCLPDTWGKLSRFPKDFCITSPMFGVHKAANMQLAFYPNGSRVAEPGHCTVALTRGPDAAGIKFEFMVNGRGIGPKVCLGRRYLGDYPKPFDDSEESKPQKVVVCMQVLEILGGMEA